MTASASTLNTYAFGNAAWTDLIALLDGRTPEDLAAWSRAWVDERARPTIRTELTISNGRIERLVADAAGSDREARADLESTNTSGYR